MNDMVVDIWMLDIFLKFDLEGFVIGWCYWWFECGVLIIVKGGGF